MLLFDKSAIQALGDKIVSPLARYFSFVDCPILRLEVLADLAKEPSQRNRDATPESVVAGLAKRVRQISHFSIPHHARLLRTNLFGHEVPFNGQIPRYDIQVFDTPEGGKGAFLDQTPESSELLAWGDKSFSEKERELAKLWRAEKQHVDIPRLKAFLRRLGYPRFKSPEDMIDWVDINLDDPKAQIQHIRRAAALFGLTNLEIARVEAIWRVSGSPMFKERFRYAHYVYRVTISFLCAIHSELIPSGGGAKPHLDLEYLYYLPFCMVFCSDDRVHRILGPIVSPSDKMLITSNDLRTASIELTSFLESLEADARKELLSDLNGYPPEIEGSLILRAWKQFMAPRSTEKRRARTPEEEASLKAMLKERLDLAFRATGKR